MRKTVHEYPKGALRHLSEIVDMKKQACAEGPVRLYRVGQRGYMEYFAITRFSNIYKHDSVGSTFIKCRQKLPVSSRWCNADTSLMDGNIPANGYNDHFWFSNRKLAEEYSAFLRADPEHQAAVRAHHQECDRLFRDF